MDYLLIKWIHIIGSTILFGTGIGSAFFMFMANRQKVTAEMYFAACHVVKADTWLTTPAIPIQFLSGMALVHMGGYDHGDAWVLWAIFLFFLTGVLWVPVFFMQIRMRNLLKQALDSGEPLPDEYWRLNRWWTALGALAFPTVLVIFYLMVFKP